MAEQVETKNGKYDILAPVVAVVFAATVAGVLACSDLNDCDRKPHKIRTLIGCVWCP